MGQQPTGLPAYRRRLGIVALQAQQAAEFVHRRLRRGLHQGARLGVGPRKELGAIAQGDRLTGGQFAFGPTILPLQQRGVEGVRRSLKCRADFADRGELIEGRLVSSVGFVQPSLLVDHLRQPDLQHRGENERRLGLGRQHPPDVGLRLLEPPVDAVRAYQDHQVVAAKVDHADSLDAEGRLAVRIG